MKIIVHAGMHKTGSTSLQLAFAGTSSPRYHYLMGLQENFSMSMFLMFEDEDKLQRHLYYRISQVSQAKLLDRRRKLRAQVDTQISSNRKPVLLVSGEDISGFNRRTVMGLANYLKSVSQDIQVITYVRPPCAYMESAFQERLKHQLVDVDAAVLWPRYQRRLRNVVDAFGVENNTFVKFDRTELLNENVIDDFSARTGLPRPKDVDQEMNSSMSAEAIALTFAYRKLVRSDPPAGPAMERVDTIFRKRLSEIGDGKLRFDAAFRAAGEAQYEGDIAWMETLLGVSLDENRGSGAGFVGSDDDLVALANDNVTALKSLNERLGAPVKSSLKDNLIALYQHCENHQARFSTRDRLKALSSLGIRGTVKRIRSRLF